MKHSIRIIGLFAVLGCLLTGCMVGPAYKTPKAPVANQWLEFEDARLKTTSPVEPRWWKNAFQDAVLDQLIEEALAG
ncbi:MAG: cusC, partial [Acidobacteria bacterium]|nr:cusC [Acidobacteriota bacterium]